MPLLKVLIRSLTSKMKKNKFALWLDHHHPRHGAISSKVFFARSSEIIIVNHLIIVHGHRICGKFENILLRDTSVLDDL